ncbi:MAG: hypothetical protein ACP5G2_04695 [Candidatus Bipolaricaulaceae bacterium]
MTLWVRRGGRWHSAHALAPYLPPDYVRLRPRRRGPRWETAGEVKGYGADTLPELIRALLSACRRPPGGAAPQLWWVSGEDRVISVGNMFPFHPEAVCGPGVEIARLARPPDRWQVTIHVARPAGGLVAARSERYLGAWLTALRQLLEASAG